ncbi:hypothetical protein CIHG_02794 [Coccidioides immitis H538.4]|uniref:Uncharacterized protein n=1 Tax=Coccidioides immitis H538.4 TaxID=396776 RepID=A0A0J8RJK1_COCIT|nr:hypothetical protein CIHG_02794 [Coccidioides immitis H538.4]
MQERVALVFVGFETALVSNEAMRRRRHRGVVNGGIVTAASGGETSQYKGGHRIAQPPQNIIFISHCLLLVLPSKVLEALFVRYDPAAA